MALTIELSAPHPLQELVEELARLRCVVHAFGATSCRVAFVDPRDPAEALVELKFFLSAWIRLHPGVVATVRE
jgi:hypothetical protein